MASDDQVLFRITACGDGHVSRTAETGLPLRVADEEIAAGGGRLAVYRKAGRPQALIQLRDASLSAVVALAEEVLEAEPRPIALEIEDGSAPRVFLSIEQAVRHLFAESRHVDPATGRVGDGPSFVIDGGANVVGDGRAVVLSVCCIDADGAFPASDIAGQADVLTRADGVAFAVQSRGYVAVEFAAMPDGTVRTDGPPIGIWYDPNAASPSALEHAIELMDAWVDELDHGRAARRRLALRRSLDDTALDITTFDATADLMRALAAARRSEDERKAAEAESGMPCRDGDATVKVVRARRKTRNGGRDG